MRARGRAASFAADQRGGVAILTAAGAVMMLGCAALAVDVGSIYLQARQLQGVADLAAVAAARDLPNARKAARATAAASGWKTPLTVKVALGVYTPNPALKPGERFVATRIEPNAVSVTASSNADLFFAPVLIGSHKVKITRRATAARAELASFSIGTRLASLHGGVANQVLSALTGSTVSLSVMDYDALADADVDLLRYSEALRTSMHLTGASFNEVLATETNTADALKVLGDLLNETGQIPAAKAALKLSAAAGPGKPVKLDGLLSLGPYGDQDHVAGASSTDVAVGSLAMAQGILALAQEGRQVKLDLGASVPGVADLDVWLAIGERPNHSPWLTVDRDGGVVIRTAQARLYVEAKALGALSGLGAQPVRLPLLLEAASAEAKLSAVQCPSDPASQSATLAVRPSLGEVAIADIDVSKLDDFKAPLTRKPAAILSLPLVKATGSAHVKLGGTSWNQVSFDRADITARRIKTVATDDIVQTAASTLLGDLDLNVTLLGLPLGLNLNLIKQSLASVLNGVAAPVDALVNSLTAILGVRLGEADVRLNGLRCRDAALVA
ncbi:pilus assembly protein TadG-related protein [Phenylobacterium sp.]|uniref:pilus assembly protein TadG-related protein n=1 Tax=Phenylobacterium sp. TaxID=1871053 RepID=UPI0027350FB1|nr:pilus assembly protein TadG-related protein [Phenylobacterium sp.]MDP3659411.1 pilus assembly protein TadG-related protein [Phenylobacterium sp.]